MDKLAKTLLLTALGILVGGATVDTWWTWFIAGPQGAFPELHDITFVQSLGLSLFIGYFFYGVVGALAAVVNNEDERLADIAVTFTYMLTAFGWLFALFYHFVLS